MIICVSEDIVSLYIDAILMYDTSDQLCTPNIWWASHKFSFQK